MSGPVGSNLNYQRPHNNQENITVTNVVGAPAINKINSLFSTFNRTVSGAFNSIMTAGGNPPVSGQYTGVTSGAMRGSFTSESELHGETLRSTMAPEAHRLSSGPSSPVRRSLANEGVGYPTSPHSSQFPQHQQVPMVYRHQLVCSTTDINNVDAMSGKDTKELSSNAHRPHNAYNCNGQQQQQHEAPSQYQQHQQHAPRIPGRSINNEFPDSDRHLAENPSGGRLPPSAIIGHTNANNGMTSYADAVGSSVHPIRSRQVPSAVATDLDGMTPSRFAPVRSGGNLPRTSSERHLHAAPFLPSLNNQTISRHSGSSTAEISSRSGRQHHFVSTGRTLDERRLPGRKHLY